MSLLNNNDNNVVTNLNINNIIEEHMYSLGFIQSLKYKWDDPAIEFNELEVAGNSINNTNPQYRRNTSQRWNRGTFVKSNNKNNIHCVPLKINEDTRWKAKVMMCDKNSVVTDDTVTLKNLKSLLNKLTIEKFDKISDKIINIINDILNLDVLNNFIDLIIQKAQFDSNFSDMYAKLCIKISKTCKLNNTFEPNIFKKLFLLKCQDDFINDEPLQVKTARPKWKNLDKYELEDKNNWAKECKKGHVKLVANLYLNNMLSDKVILICINHYIKNQYPKDENNLIYLCELVKIIYNKMKQNLHQNDMVNFIDTINKIIESDVLTCRIKFILKDLQDLYLSNKICNKDEKPMKLKDIRIQLIKENSKNSKKIYSDKWSKKFQ